MAEAAWTRQGEAFLLAELAVKPANEPGHDFTQDPDHTRGDPHEQMEDAPISDDDARVHMESRKGMRLDKEITFSRCSLRCGTRYASISGGVAFTMCAGCGYLFYPVVLHDDESTRMILYMIISLFQGYAYAREPLRGDAYGSFLVIFDDACHLLRMAKSMEDQHPEVKRLLDSATLIVDKFHFMHNHKGKWCNNNVNPLTNQFMLSANKGLNTEVCEQRFKHIAGFKSVLHGMNFRNF